MLNQPVEDIKLPSDLRAALERSRNLVTVNEAEALRLKELAASYKYTINELQKSKVDLEEACEKLKAAVAEYKATETSALAKLEVLRQEERDLITRKNALLTETAAINQEQEVAANDLKTREAAAVKKAAELEEQERVLAVRVNEIEAAEARIEAFAKSLWK